MSCWNSNPSNTTSQVKLGHYCFSNLSQNITQMAVFKKLMGRGWYYMMTLAGQGVSVIILYHEMFLVWESGVAVVTNQTSSTAHSIFISVNFTSSPPHFCLPLYPLPLPAVTWQEQITDQTTTQADAWRLVTHPSLSWSQALHPALLSPF